MSFSGYESKTFLSEELNVSDGDAKSFSTVSSAGANRKSKKSYIKRKFGRKKDEGKKDLEKELKKVNDNFWPVGNRSFTTQEMVAIGCGTLAGNVEKGIIHNLNDCLVCLGIASIFVVAAAGYGPVATATGMIAGGLTAVTMPHAIYNQTALTKLETLRDVVNAMRASVNTFANTNKDLHNNIDVLENHVEQLKEIENNLMDLAKTQGMQLEELNELLEENRRINAAMTQVLRASALQRILALLLECDIDGDFKLSGMELNRFIVGLSSIEELSVDKEQLHQGLKEYEDFDINTFLDLIQDLIFPDDDGDDDKSDIQPDEWEEAAVVEAVQLVDGREYLKKQKNRLKDSAALAPVFA